MNGSWSITEQITRHFGGEHRPEVFKRLADNEPLLNAVWNSYQTVMTDGEVDLQTKELLGFTVAIAKPSEYVIGLQQRRIRRVGIDDTAEQETLAVAAYFEGLSAFAQALRVDSDIRRRHLEAGDSSRVDQEIEVNVSYVVDSEDAVVAPVYEEIRTSMGISFVPNIFKAMAHQPTMLQAKWDCYKAVMLEGVLSRTTKELIAIAVSAVNGCTYCANAHAAAVRQLGLTEQGLTEAACVIDLFANLCTLAKGFRLGKRNF